MNKLLSEIHNFHSNPENFKEIKVDDTIIDADLFAFIERNYKKYFELQIKHFPYILKSQFIQLLPTKRSNAYRLLNELEKHDLIINYKTSTAHYIAPSNKTMRWYEKSESPKKKFNRAATPRQLALNFLKAEYFLAKGELLHTADYFFDKLLWFVHDKKYQNLSIQYKSTDEELKKITAEELKIMDDISNGNLMERMTLIQEHIKKRVILEQNLDQLKADMKAITSTKKVQGLFNYYTPAVKELYLHMKNRKDIQNLTFDFDSKRTDGYLFLQKALETLHERQCFLRNARFEKDKVHFDFSVIHLNGTALEKYNRLLSEINNILYCIENASFSIEIVVENEDLANNIQIYLSNHYFEVYRKDGAKKGYINDVKDITTFNADLDKYNFTGNTNAYKKDLEQVDKELKSINEELFTD